MKRVFLVVITVSAVAFACKRSDESSVDSKQSHDKLVEIRGKNQVRLLDSSLSNADLARECKLLSDKRGGLTVDDRKRQVVLLRMAGLRNPEHLFDILRMNVDLNDFDVSTQVIADVMKEKGQAIVLDQFRKLGNLMTDHESNRLMIGFFKVLSTQERLDPEVVAFLHEFSAQDVGSSSISSMIRTRAVALGVEASLTLVDEIGLTGKAKDESLLAISDVYSNTDPAEALALMRKVNRIDAATAYQNLFEKWFSRSPNDATRAFAELSWKEKSNCFKNKLVINKIIASGASSALWDSLDDVPATQTGVAEATGLLGILATTENGSKRVLDFVQSLPKGKTSTELIGNVFESMAESNPDTAIESATSLVPELQSQAMRSIVKVLAGTDYRRSLDLAASAPPAFQQNMYREIARAVTYSNSEQAVGILEDPAICAKLGDGFRSEMLNHTVQTWAAQDCDSAQAWVEKLPERDLPKGVQGLMASWMKKDPVAASEWLAKMPPGVARDAGAMQIIQQVKNTDPEMADQWRKSLTPKSAN